MQELDSGILDLDCDVWDSVSCLSAREILFGENDERRLNKKIKTLIIINCFFFISPSLRILCILNNIFSRVFIVFNAVLAFVSSCFMCAHFLSFGPFFSPRSFWPQCLRVPFIIPAVFLLYVRFKPLKAISGSRLNLFFS